MDIFEAITALADYAVRTGLIEENDRVYSVNSLLEALHLDSYEEREVAGEPELVEILNAILDYACKNGLCEDSVVYRDLFDTKIMGLLTPRPSWVIDKFESIYAESPKAATDFYYDFSKKTNYIRADRLAKDVKWITPTPYGDIDMTINLSKPEKDPRAIAAALKMKQSAYPKCQLCRENEGYAGRVNHPARQNHRIIPLTMGGEPWFLQYSPYGYYNEHCIAFNGNHTPMAINKAAFEKLFDFVKRFPHYFIGSNADLPIVGGSILTHEHFQGGCYTFAMTKAEIEFPFEFKGYGDIEAGIVRWPMSVLRLRGEDTARICELADKVLAAWKSYTDEEAFIYAETEGVPHNAITPIARFANGKYEIDLVLRNNITTPEFPDGYYHPHPEYHHIKRENIGLIEVMGLAVLPARLKTELELLEKALLSGSDIAADERIAKHKEWALDIAARYELNADNCTDILRQEVGKVFAAILEQCGVFERNEKGRAQFVRFLESIKTN